MVEVSLALLSRKSGIFLVLSSIQGLAKSSRIFLLLLVLQVVEQGHEGVGDTEVETEVRLSQISFNVEYAGETLFARRNQPQIL